VSVGRGRDGVHSVARRVVLRDGRALGFVELGAPGGRPVLYFHGAMGSPLRRCSAVDAALARLGVRYVMVHRPGFGRSDPLPGRSVLGWASDVAELADALGLGRFAVLGVSAGAPYAAACAHALPGRVDAAALVSGLTPLGPDAGLPRGHRAALAALRAFPGPVSALLGGVARGARARPELLVAALAARQGRADADALADDAARDAFVEGFRAATARGVAPMVEDLLLAWGPWGFDPAEVRSEVHVWHGELDRTVPVHHARALAAALPRHRLEVADGEGHFFFRRRVAEILAALLGTAAPTAPAAAAPAAAAPPVAAAPAAALHVAPAPCPAY